MNYGMYVRTNLGKRSVKKVLKIGKCIVRLKIITTFAQDLKYKEKK